MTSYELAPDQLHALKGRTVLITGGATGIGRAAIDLAYIHGANIALGDWNESEGLEIEKALGSRCLFRKCDVSKFDDVLELFQAAWLKFGSVNAVLSNAGVNTNEGLLVDEYDEKTGKLLPPSYRSIEINLYGQINVVKCAMHYFAKDSTPAQIVMTASAAAFLPAPPIHLYCAAKSGVLGLMRALRPDMESRNTTINVVCPWMTLTPMVLPGWQAAWGDLPMNSSEGVAKALLLPLIDKKLNGKAFFVAGDQITEFEDSLGETQEKWMGETLSENVNKGQDFLLSENAKSR